MFESDIGNESPSCFHCRQEFDEKVLIKRTNYGGCIAFEYFLCGACAKELDAQESAQRYQEKHFCYRCNSRFKRPYFKNRKHLSAGEFWFGGSYSYCPACYEIEKAKLPKREEEVDPCGEYTERDLKAGESGLW